MLSTVLGFLPAKEWVEEVMLFEKRTKTAVVFKNYFAQSAQGYKNTERNMQLSIPCKNPHITQILFNKQNNLLHWCKSMRLKKKNGKYRSS